MSILVLKKCLTCFLRLAPKIFEELELFTDLMEQLKLAN